MYQYCPLFFDTYKALEFRDYFLDLEKYVVRVKQDVNIIWQQQNTRLRHQIKIYRRNFIAKWEIHRIHLTKYHVFSLRKIFFVFPLQSILEQDKHDLFVTNNPYMNMFSILKKLNVLYLIRKGLTSRLYYDFV